MNYDRQLSAAQRAYDSQSPEDDADYARRQKVLTRMEREAATRLRAVAGEPVAWTDAVDACESRVDEMYDGSFSGSLGIEKAFQRLRRELSAASPQPAASATVTDEDVERAMEAADLVFAKHFGTRPDADEIDTAMVRAALESFANKERE